MMRKISSFVWCTLISLYFALAIAWDYTGSLSSLEFTVKFIFAFCIAGVISLIFNTKFKFVFFDKKTEKINWKEFILYFLILILPILYMVYAYYPAVGTPDTFQIWNDFTNNGRIISDWHPVVYQIIFSIIPRFFWNNIYSTLIAQVLLVIIVTMYMCYFFRKNFLNFKQTILVLLIIVLNPIFLKYSIYVMKDIPHAYFILLFTMYLINVIKSDGKWLNKFINKTLFIIAAVGVLTMRHNGLIPFTATFLVLFFKMAKLRKFVLISFSSIMIVFLILTGPIYRKFDIWPNGGRIESIGIILNSLSYYYNNDAIIENDEKIVYYRIHRDKIWKDLYHPRDFNLIKNYSPNFVECSMFPKYCDNGFGDRLDENFEEVLATWFKLTKKNPGMFIKSYLNTTSPIWEIKKEIAGIDFYWHKEIQIEGINLKLHDGFEKYYKFVVSSPLRIIGIGIGEGLLIIVLSTYIIMKKFKFDLKKLVPLIPVLSNSACIMLLMTGEEYRFVYSQTICAIPILIYALSLKSKNRIVNKLKG